MRVRRLLSHLAQFSSFSNQGELLCTQGLAYLLRIRVRVRHSGTASPNEGAGRLVGPDLAS